MDNPTSERLLRKARRREKVRLQVLDAARVVLARDGLENLTIPLVAAQADVSKPAVYYYFEDKNALVREIIFDGVVEQVAALRRAVDAAPTGLHALEAVPRALVEHYVSSLARFRLHYLWSQVTGFNSPELVKRLEPVMNGLFDAIEAKLVADRAAGRLHAKANPRRLAVSAWIVGFGLTSFASLFESTGSSSKHALTDLLAEVNSAFVRGASTAGASRPPTARRRRGP